MARKLDDIFNECYERVRSGEHLESVLSSYSEHATELERLLRTAFDIGRRGSYIQPRPDFRYWTGVRLQGAYQYARQQKQKPAGRGFNWSTAWAVALTAIIIVVVSGIGTATAASDAMPDEALYSVKLATEQARLALTFSESAKAELYARLAEKRVIEIETMVAQGKTELAATTAEKLADHLEIASANIAQMTGAAPAATAIAPTTAKPTATPQVPAAEEPKPSPPQPVTPSQEPTTTQEPAPAPQQPPQQEATATGTSVTEPADEQKKAGETRAEKMERLRTLLEKSTVRSVNALQKAMEEAPPEAKPKLQKTIDRFSKFKKEDFSDHKFDKKNPGDEEPEGDNSQDSGTQQEEPSSSLNKPSQTSQSADNDTAPSGQHHSGPKTNRR